MDDYRIYLLDGAGRIVSGADSQCRDDEAACEAALALAGERGEAEVWQGVRCVGRVSRSPGMHALPATPFAPAGRLPGHDLLTSTGYACGTNSHEVRTMSAIAAANSVLSALQINRASPGGSTSGKSASFAAGLLDGLGASSGGSAASSSTANTTVTTLNADGTTTTTVTGANGTVISSVTTGGSAPPRSQSASGGAYGAQGRPSASGSVAALLSTAA